MPRLVLLCVALLFASRVARADDREGRLLLGLGAHVVTPVSEVCDQDGDVVACSTLRFYGGGDLSGHYYLLDWLALGARVAGSKDLDASRDVSSLGETEEHSQWLWRFSAEARLHLPVVPLWVSGELGGAVVLESYRELGATGDEVGSGSASQEALLLGLGTGLDFRLGESLALGLDARVQLMTFGDDPPRLKASARASEFGNVGWVTLGARLSYLF